MEEEKIMNKKNKERKKEENVLAIGDEGVELAIFSN